MLREIELPEVVNHGSFFLMLRCIAQECAQAVAYQGQLSIDVLSMRLVPLSVYRWLAYYDAVSRGGSAQQIVVNLEKQDGFMCARSPFLNDCWQFDAAKLIDVLIAARMSKPVKSQAEVVADAVNANFEADGKFDEYRKPSSAADVEGWRVWHKAKREQLADLRREVKLARMDQQAAKAFKAQRRAKHCPVIALEGHWINEASLRLDKAVAALNSFEL